METSTVLNIALWVFTILGYIIWNLISKNKKLEEMVSTRDQTLSAIQSLIEESDKVIQQSDLSGAFKSDDQVGAFFKVLKNIQDQLNYFIANS